MVLAQVSLSRRLVQLHVAEMGKVKDEKMISDIVDFDSFLQVDGKALEQLL